MSEFHDSRMPPVAPPTYPGSPSQEATVGDHQTRIRRLEAVPPAGLYLNPFVQRIYGQEFLLLTSLNNFNGGNGTDPVGGSWTAVADSAAPWGGYIESTVDDDWFAFPMQLGPQYSGWAVAVWYYAASDAGKFEIDWATSPADERSNTPTGPIGSSTSMISPLDWAYWGADAFSWYNTANTGDLSHTYKVDAYSVSPGWGNPVVERSPFVIMGADGTMLTANGSASTLDFEWNRDFNGGGGRDVVWWCRIHTNGKNASSSGYRTRIAGITVYPFNAASAAFG